MLKFKLGSILREFGMKFQCTEHYNFFSSIFLTMLKYFEKIYYKTTELVHFKSRVSLKYWNHGLYFNYFYHLDFDQI